MRRAILNLPNPTLKYPGLALRVPEGECRCGRCLSERYPHVKPLIEVYRDLLDVGDWGEPIHRRVGDLFPD